MNELKRKLWIEKGILEEKRKLRICDFFSGTHSWTKPYGEDEATIFSIDNNDYFKDSTTVIKDFMELTADEVREHLGGNPDVIYASFPCTTFSVASMGKHWGGGFRAYIPKSKEAIQALKMLDHLIALIEELNPRYFFMENPRAMMRKMSHVENMVRETVWYCKYGPTEGILRAKPTDIFGRFPWTWIPRPQCKNHKFENGIKVSNHCGHVSARRGAKTGTQGMKGNMTRSMIPKELCEEIANAIKEVLI